RARSRWGRRGGSLLDLAGQFHAALEGGANDYLQWVFRSVWQQVAYGRFHRIDRRFLMLRDVAGEGVNRSARDTDMAVLLGPLVSPLACPLRNITHQTALSWRAC